MGTQIFPQTFCGKVSAIHHSLPSTLCVSFNKTLRFESQRGPMNTISIPKGIFITFLLCAFLIATRSCNLRGGKLCIRWKVQNNSTPASVILKSHPWLQLFSECLIPYSKLVNLHRLFSQLVFAKRQRRFHVNLALWCEKKNFQCCCEGTIRRGK